MTNDRAIELLRRISDSQFDGPHGDERREALEMAVRALESNLVKESGDLVKDLVEDSSSDLISRQETIEYCVGNKTWHDEDRATGDTIYRQDAIDAINRISRTSNWKAATTMVIAELSSAQPERKTGQLLYHHTEDIDEERTADVYFCSSCKEEVLKKIRFGFCGGELDIHYGFCPICGARLSGENDD